MLGLNRISRATLALILFLVLAAALIGVGAAAAPDEELLPLHDYLLRAREIPRYEAEIVREHPHDPEAFTQGLIIHDGVLYESTGLHGRSTLRKVDLETGAVLLARRLPPAYFGEGLALLQGSLYQLTWNSRTGLVYDLETLEQRRTFSYDSEGWGLASDGFRLVMTDGTEVLRFMDPDTFTETRRVSVRARKKPVIRLNELEVVGGEIWANVWQTPVVVRINPRTGRVEGWIDLTPIVRLHRDNPEHVANGIAHDPATGRLFVTGKRWPKLYEIRLVRK